MKNLISSTASLAPQKNFLSSSNKLLSDSLKQAPRLALPFFIFLAALLHFSTIYLFKIVYQPSHVSKPIPAQVLFLPPHSLSSEQMTHWLKSNDSSIFSPLKTIQAIRPTIPASLYEPEPAALPLHPLPPLPQKEESVLLPPTSEPSIPVLVPNATSPPPTATSSAVQQATTIELPPPLSTRLLKTLSPPSLPPEASLPLPPTKLTLNIDPTGTPIHVFVSQSCGNQLVDEAASRWAMTLHFSPAADDTWGTLLLLWGIKP